MCVVSHIRPYSDTGSTQPLYRKGGKQTHLEKITLESEKASCSWNHTCEVNVPSFYAPLSPERPPSMGIPHSLCQWFYVNFQRTKTSFPDVQWASQPPFPRPHQSLPILCLVPRWLCLRKCQLVLKMQLSDSVCFEMILLQRGNCVGGIPERDNAPGSVEAS